MHSSSFLCKLFFYIMDFVWTPYMHVPLVMLILFHFPLICRLLLNRVDGQHEMANMQCMQMDLHHKLNLRCSTTKRAYTHAHKRKRLAHKVCFRHFYVFINCGKSFKTNFDTYKKNCLFFSDVRFFQRKNIIAWIWTKKEKVNKFTFPEIRQQRQRL